MNATPTPDGWSGSPDDQGDSGAQPSPVPLAESVPPQKRRTPDATRAGEPGADPLDDPDPRTAAQAAAVESLLRCWVRETNLAAPATHTLRIPLPASGTALTAPIRHWSPTGWHRFGPPRLAGAPETAPPVDAVSLAALLARETAGDREGGSASKATAAGEGADLVARVADSLRRTAVFVRDRRARPADGPDLFLSAEQALLLGHPLHPTPKSREGLTEAPHAPTRRDRPVPARRLLRPAPAPLAGA